jgi:hypothetical protein
VPRPAEESFPQRRGAQPDLTGAPGREFLCDSGKTGRVPGVGPRIAVDGGIDIADGLQCAAEIVQGLDAPGVLRQRGAKGRNGVGSVASLDHGRSEIVQQQGIPRTDRDGFAKHLDGGAEISVRESRFGFIDHGGEGVFHMAQQVASGAGAGLSCERFAQHHGGRAEPAGESENAALSSQGLGRAISGGRAGDPGAGFVETAGLGEQHGQQAHGGGLAGFGRRAAGGDGGGRVAGTVQVGRGSKGVLWRHARTLHVARRAQKSGLALWVIRMVFGAVLLSWSGQARADSDPKEALEDLPLDLGPVQSFADPASAQRHCGGDVVVWADPATGYFHGPRSREFRGAHGGFTCLHAAAAAGYWDTNPFAGGNGRGRSFPIDPSLRPEIGS